MLAAIMAITDGTHAPHLVGDVPFGFVLPLALFWAWRPVRTLLPESGQQRR